MRRQDVIDCLILSGFKSYTIIVWADDRGEAIEEFYQASKSSTPNYCLCGPAVDTPESVAFFCNRIPSGSKVYICPVYNFSWGKDLQLNPAFVSPAERRGGDVSGFRCVYECTGPLEGDCYGQAARRVAAGKRVYNGIRTTLKTGLFYDAVLHRNGTPDFWLVDEHSFHLYFPNIELHIKEAAKCVPVWVRNASEFKQEYDVSGDFLNVMVASDYLIGSKLFMAFYNVFGGELAVGVSKSGMETADYVCHADAVYERIQ